MPSIDYLWYRIQRHLLIQVLIIVPSTYLFSRWTSSYHVHQTFVITVPAVQLIFLSHHLSQLPQVSHFCDGLTTVKTTGLLWRKYCSLFPRDTSHFSPKACCTTSAPTVLLFLHKTHVGNVWKKEDTFPNLLLQNIQGVGTWNDLRDRVSNWWWRNCQGIVSTEKESVNSGFPPNALSFSFPCIPAVLKAFGRQRGEFLPAGNRYSFLQSVYVLRLEQAYGTGTTTRTWHPRMFLLALAQGPITWRRTRLMKILLVFFTALRLHLLCLLVVITTAGQGAFNNATPTVSTVGYK